MFEHTFFKYFSYTTYQRYKSIICCIGEILLWTDFWFNMLLKCKASMPLLANLTFRKGRFLVSEGSPTLTSLKSLLEEISKMIPWSRCSAKKPLKFQAFRNWIQFIMLLQAGVKSYIPLKTAAIFFLANLFPKQGISAECLKVDFICMG